MIKFFVDSLCYHGFITYGRRTKTCHLFTDGNRFDLIAFGSLIGIKDKWLHVTKRGFIHFDITTKYRNKAIELGAIELDRKQFVELVYKK